MLSARAPALLQMRKLRSRGRAICQYRPWVRDQDVPYLVPTPTVSPPFLNVWQLSVTIKNCPLRVLPIVDKGRDDCQGGGEWAVAGGEPRLPSTSAHGLTPPRVHLRTDGQAFPWLLRRHSGVQRDAEPHLSPAPTQGPAGAGDVLHAHPHGLFQRWVPEAPHSHAGALTGCDGNKGVWGQRAWETRSQMRLCLCHHCRDLQSCKRACAS